jgi:hypothetical protein
MIAAGHSLSLLSNFNVVDPGYAVDPGVQTAPNQPRSPDPPRYFPGSRDEGIVV